MEKIHYFFLFLIFHDFWLLVQDHARWEQISLIYNEIPECNVAGESLIATLVDGDN